MDQIARITVRYKLLHQFACPIPRAVIDIDNAKVVIILGNDRRKVKLMPLAIVIAWYNYGDLFHGIVPLYSSGKGHVACLTRWVLYFSTIVSNRGAPAGDCDGDHPSSDTGEPLRHAMACAIIAPLGRIPSSHGSGAICRREGR